MPLQNGLLLLLLLSRFSRVQLCATSYKGNCFQIKKILSGLWGNSQHPTQTCTRAT